MIWSSNMAEESAFSTKMSLSIITVVLRGHIALLARNVALVKRLNPGVNWRLIVVNNDAAELQDVIASLDNRIQVVPGAKPDATLASDILASYHHAAGLALGLRAVDSDYTLVLDPDLFVVRPGWIREIVAHMQARRLAFFGVPWHPRWYGKYRGFPCPHFMMCDGRMAPFEGLDFTPELKHQAPLGKQAKRWSSWKRALVRPLYRLGYPVLSRTWIGSQHDTGVRVARSHRHLAHEEVMPVVDLDRDFTSPAFLRAGWGRSIDRLFPRRWRFLPEPGTFVSLDSAPSAYRKSAAVNALGAELFVWRGQPFAMHLRGMARPQDGSPGQTEALLEAALSEIATSSGPVP